MSTIGDNNDEHGGSGEKTSSKKECTSCEQNNVDNITEGVDNVVLDNNVSACASCGKEGNNDDMNTCNKCKMVKYCNAACKKKHRTKHKKACEKRVAELHDEKLFKDPPPNEECPICMLPLPPDTGQSVFMSCCGKVCCNGCIYSMKMRTKGIDICAFCRTPYSFSGKEEVGRIKKLINKGNEGAFYYLAGIFARSVGCSTRS